MKKLLTTTGLSLVVALMFTGSVQAKMEPYVEKALQQVCYSSASDRLYQFKKTVKGYRLSMKDVANKVVCNGEDIGTFAAEQGAFKTASYIRTHQTGKVNISELASVEVQLKPKT